eukprot:scaffold5814_cov117-Cylindrotheca_fusiformis.AAC.2
MGGLDGVCDRRCIMFILSTHSFVELGTSGQTRRRLWARSSQLGNGSKGLSFIWRTWNKNFGTTVAVDVAVVGASNKSRLADCRSEALKGMG